MSDNAPLSSNSVQRNHLSPELRGKRNINILSITNSNINAEQPSIGYLVDVSTQTNTSLTSITSLDGRTLIDGDTVLLYRQTDKTENGLYEFESGDLTRLQWDIFAGLRVGVKGGQYHKGLQFVSLTNEPDIGTDDISFITYSEVKYIGETTDDSDTEIFINTSGQIEIPNTAFISGVIIAQGDNNEYWRLRDTGVVNNGGTITIYPTNGIFTRVPTTTTDYNVRLENDNTNHSIKLIVTGAAGDTVTWQAYLTKREIY